MRHLLVWQSFHFTSAFTNKCTALDIPDHIRPVSSLNIRKVGKQNIVPKIAYCRTARLAA
jgi:hypothetical protein